MQTISDLRQQLLAIFDTLSSDDQERLLSFAQELAHEPEGISGKDLAAFFAQSPITEEDAENMQRIWDEIEREERGKE